MYFFSGAQSGFDTLEDSHPEDLRPPKHDHVPFVGQRALPFIGDRRREVVHFDVIRSCVPLLRCRGMHVTIAVLRHVVKVHGAAAADTPEDGRRSEKRVQGDGSPVYGCGEARSQAIFICELAKARPTGVDSLDTHGTSTNAHSPIHRWALAAGKKSGASPGKLGAIKP